MASCSLDGIRARLVPKTSIFQDPEVTEPTWVKKGLGFGFERSQFESLHIIPGPRRLQLLMPQLVEPIAEPQ